MTPLLASAARRPLPAGHRLGEYLIEKPLGVGGFGITYLGHDLALELPVAIKEYFPVDGTARGDDHSIRLEEADEAAAHHFHWGLDRFLDEARALASLRHPHIVRVLRYFRAHGTAYIVMEFEPGVLLPAWLKAQAPLGRAALLGLVDPLLDGLEAVHQAGLLHRDIKPANIAVRPRGGPVMLDFGAARRVVPGRDITAIYSPGYAPLEQYHSRGKHGPWTDLYALGAVMYRMVTGEAPPDALVRSQEDTLVPACERADPARLGSRLLAAIDWAMALPEDSRPQSVAAFRDALRHAALEPLAQGEALPGFVGTPQLLAALERALAQHIGPMAALLVQRELRRASDLPGLVEALAAEVPRGTERARFLAAARTLTQGPA